MTVQFTMAASFVPTGCGIPHAASCHQHATNSCHQNASVDLIELGPLQYNHTMNHEPTMYHAHTCHDVKWVHPCTCLTCVHTHG